MKRTPEGDLLDQVLTYARWMGWRSFHSRPAGTAQGFRTPVQGDGKGFLDVVLVRERVVWIELKSPEGSLTPEQNAWIDALLGAGQEVHVWTTEDWKTIERTLKR